MSYCIEAHESLTRFSEFGGGKARNLAALTQLGCPVPEWFCVSSVAFEEFLKANRLHEKLIPTEPFATFAEGVESLLTRMPIPDLIVREIQMQIAKQGLNGLFLAVRSSGLDEDSAENSFAGQFSSYLFQRGLDAVLLSLRKCWASAYSERALSYRRERGLPLTGIAVGVVIQKMVNADSAGVAFSRHPIRILDRDQLLISSVWGLGEGLVSGALDSDNFEVHRTTWAIQTALAEKTEAFRQDPGGGVRAEPTDPARVKESSLTEEQVREVARLCVDLEAKLGAPQDCEWAFESGKLYCVQTRPITNLPPPNFYDLSLRGEGPILWDNSNIIESYSGVTSPLTFSFASRAYRQVYIQFCEVMGVPQAEIHAREEMFRNMLGLLRGRIYYNLVNWYRLVLMLPGSSNNKGFMETMMGVKQQLKPEVVKLFDFVNHPLEYSLGDKLRLIWGTIQRFRNIDSIVSTFQAHFETVYQDARQKDFTRMPLDAQLAQYHHLEEQLLKRWHAPIINDYLCMVFFGLIKRLTEKWVAADSEGSSLQNDLLCGQGDLESTEPTKSLMRIAEWIDTGDAQIRAWFLSKPSDEIWREIRDSGRYPELRARVYEFLDKYGFRCVNELKLEEPDLHDDPAFAINSIASYVRTKSYSISKMEEREREIRGQAEAKLRTLLSGWKLSVYLWVLKHTRKAVRNRENLRFARTKVFGVARHLFRGMGLNLVRLGFLSDPKDVFFITVEELIGFAEGRAVSVDLKPMVASRRREYAAYDEQAPPPDRFLTYGAAGVTIPYAQVLSESDLLAADRPVNTDPNVLVGTPCCPGVIEGVVRVVKELKEAEGLNGEILVTSRTDPGWVPLYPSCSGLLIERGSLLSHSAVVARELGLPTIVGISGGLMTKLKTGMRVKIDAGRGEVRILE
ncbi:MAG: phosphoenolpyruvate synthase [Bdellovibrionaceae bacterium]|nr:phosphoenolpyruvate synthase [Pseudobdellovibrionaceae bacterium]